MLSQRTRFASPEEERMRHLREELVHRVAAAVGGKQVQQTEIPGLTLHRRTAPSKPALFGNL